MCDFVDRADEEFGRHGHERGCDDQDEHGDEAGYAGVVAGLEAFGVEDMARREGGAHEHATAFGA